MIPNNPSNSSNGNISPGSNLPPYPPPHPPAQSNNVFAQLFPHSMSYDSTRSPSPSNSPEQAYPELTTVPNTVVTNSRPRPAQASASAPMSSPTPVPTLSSPLHDTEEAVPPVPKPGTKLSGSSCTYSRIDGDKNDVLEVTPITLYNSGSIPSKGDLISVNDRYITYPIRNGLIRVINQTSVSRILIRHHEGQKVTDLSFFNNNTNLLLSCSVDPNGSSGRIVITKLTEDRKDNREYEIMPEVQKALSIQADRVKWHATDPNKILILRSGQVYVVDLTQEISQDHTEMETISLKCKDDEESVIDSIVSSCGDYVISAVDDGCVSIYSLQNAVYPGQVASVRQFQYPINDNGFIDSLISLGNDSHQLHLLVGSAKNSFLSLWRIPLSEMDVVCEQTFSITTNSDNLYSNIIKVDGNKEFLILADGNSPELYALHISHSSSQDVSRYTFDNITQFSLNSRILSMIVSNQESADRGVVTEVQPSPELQLFCIQTSAIQQYHVNISHCYIPDFIDSVQSSSAEFLSPDLMTANKRTDSLSQTVGAQTTETNGNRLEQSASETPASYIQFVPPTTTPSRSSSENPEVGETKEDMPTPPLSVEESRNEVDDSRQPPNMSIPGFDPRYIGGMLQQMELLQQQREKRQREYLSKSLQLLNQNISSQIGQYVEKSMKKELQRLVIPVMSRIVAHTMKNEFLEPLETKFNDVLNESMIPAIQNTVGKEACREVSNHMGDAVSSIVDDVSKSLESPVRDAFRECFQTVIIPSFQAATQKMFEQINKTFLQSMNNLNSKDESLNVDDLKTQMGVLIDQVSKLSAKVETLSEQVCKSEERLDSTGMLTRSSSTSSIADQHRNLQDLIQVEKYEEAYRQALAAQNVELVVYVCLHTNPDKVFGVRPMKISQSIILCLIQQLGTDLHHEIETKLLWLRYSLLALNKNDANIAAYSTNVLVELQGRLGSVLPENRNSEFCMIHHVLKSMLSG